MMIDLYITQTYMDIRAARLNTLEIIGTMIIMIEESLRIKTILEVIGKEMLMNSIAMTDIRHISMKALLKQI